MTSPGRFWAAWGTLALLIVVLYLPQIPGLVNEWTDDPDNEHGMLIPFMCAWLIWRNREQLRKTPVCVCWPALGGMLAAYLLYLVCSLGHLAVLARASFVFLFYFTVLLTLGREFERRLRFPILFLLFMVPVPVSARALVAFPLQLFASRVSAAILNGVGVVAVREGNVLHLSNMSLEVAAACSGIRSMVSYMMLGVFFSYISRNRRRVTVALLALAIPIALAANIARVVLSGLAASWFGPKTAEGFLHQASGLLMFAAGFVIFLGLNALLNRIWPAKRSAGRETEGLVASESSPARTVGSRPHPALGATTVAALLLVVGILVIQAASHRARVEIVEPRLAGLPFVIGEWRGTTTRFVENERIDQILGVDISILRVYQRDNDTVMLYVGYYGTEKGGRSSHNPESCYVGAGWTIRERGLAQLTPEGMTHPVTVNHLVTGRGEIQEELLHWYQVAGTDVVRGGIKLNLLRFWRGVLENRNDGAFIRVTSLVDPRDPERAFQLAREFAAAIIPLFPSYWPVEREASSKQATKGGQANRKGR